MTLEPFYKIVIIRRFHIKDNLKVDHKSIVSKQKCIDNVEK